MSASGSTRIGTEVAGYRIERLIGQGGMGVVYLAEHVRLGRKVALKLLAPALSAQADFRERFIDEARRAAQLDHPNIVPIFDAGEADGELYIAMHYVPGSDLKTLIQREGQISIGRALFILEQIASALDTAHEHDLIHRDVKPGNILIAEPSETVYLTDFGIAKHTATRGMTRTGMFVGTGELAAPEQIEGRPVDARTDVYALGCVLYECLTGKPPFERETEFAVLHAHLADPPPLLTASRPDLPKSLNRVLASAMAKTKEDRYASCGELIDEARRAVLKRTTTSARIPAAEPWSDPAEMGEDAAIAPAAETIVPASQTSVPAPAAASQVAAAVGPPAAGGGGSYAGPPPGSAGQRPQRWLVFGLIALVAAALSGAVVYFVAGSGSSSPSASSTSTGAVTTAAGTTGTGTTTAGPAVAPPGLIGVVQNPVWPHCKASASPLRGAASSAVCVPNASDSGFFPQRLELFIYPNGAALKKAFEAVRASDPKSAALVEGRGTCNNVTWSGFGPWHHANGDLGGRRYCFFDAKHQAVVVWTHERLGTPSHLDFMAIASDNSRGDNRLFSWWNFWHQHLGKCFASATCVAHVS